MPQDIISDVEAAVLRQPFSRHNQEDWLRSLKLVARAQAMLWHETNMARRWELLAQAEAEMDAQKGAR